MKPHHVICFAIISVVTLSGSSCSDGSIGEAEENEQAQLDALTGTWLYDCHIIDTTKSETIELTFDNTALTETIKQWNNTACTDPSTSDATKSLIIALGDNITTTGNNTATEIDILDTTGDEDEVLYDIYRINTAGTILYFGDKSSSSTDGSDSFKRPTGIDSTAEYDKQ